MTPGFLRKLEGLSYCPGPAPSSILGKHTCCTCTCHRKQDPSPFPMSLPAPSPACLLHPDSLTANVHEQTLSPCHTKLLNATPSLWLFLRKIAFYVFLKLGTHSLNLHLGLSSKSKRVFFLISSTLHHRSLPRKKSISDFFFQIETMTTDPMT